MVDSVSVRFKNAGVEKMPLKIIVYSGMREPLALRAKNASVSGVCVSALLRSSAFFCQLELFFSWVLPPEIAENCLEFAQKLPEITCKGPSKLPEDCLKIARTCYTKKLGVCTPN